MKVITTIREMQQTAAAEKRNGKTIGFVPTMGFLHDGHLSLVRRAAGENDLVAMSVFVNPLQFGPNEDYEQYPRDIQKDEAAAKNEGVDILFYPSTEEMYPGEPAVSVTVGKRADVLCGKSRPGHFDGVATVLTKLFHIVMPDAAYFGMKDAQQVAVVDGLIDDLNFPVRLVGCPTVREADGLAKSSRNVYLSDAERREAPALYQGLQLGAEAYKSGERNANRLRETVIGFLNNRLTKGEIEYVSVLAYPELTKADLNDGQIIIAVAVRFETARLIDNVVLGGENGC
ncbi:MAG TPA: pantoate--beta-alanine ligase [Bacillales bacterium]|nr:pantoate--beta-alanine ligase [Bacillales bacterium]